LDEGCCSSAAEARVLAESVLSELAEEPAEEGGSGTNDASIGTLPSSSSQATSNDEEVTRQQQQREQQLLLSTMRRALREVVGVSDRESESIARRCLDFSRRRYGADETAATTTDDDDSDDDERGEEEEDDGDDSDSDNDWQYLGEGECELCERGGVKLTKHHLVPKSTWPRLVPRLQRMYLQLCGTNRKERDGNENEPEDRDDPLLSLVRDLDRYEGDRNAAPTAKAATAISKSDVKWMLRDRTCAVCRPCHSAVHRAVEDNLTLALEYNTVEALLEHVQIRNFAKWQNKQKAGKYAVK